MDYTTIYCIGIRFSDNDFSIPVFKWLQSFVDTLKYKGYLDGVSRRPPLTNEYCVSLFKETIGAFYLLYHSDNEKFEDCSTLEYLKEYPVSFHINEQVHEYVNGLEDMWDNGEFSYWDGQEFHNI